MKKLSRENKVQAALQRLDRLTKDEGLATMAQTFSVVCSLDQNMKAVMDGEQAFPVSVSHSELDFLLDGKLPADPILETLRTLSRQEQASALSDTASEVMQENASETSELKRKLFPYITDREY